MIEQTVEELTPIVGTRVPGPGRLGRDGLSPSSAA
jgi:hypothetical protein